jgi:aspartate/glutamate racemase
VLGLVGGLGPNATVYYYNGLIAAHKAQGRVARMLIAHSDVDHGRPLAEAGQLYRRSGWSEIPRFNDDPYPDLFFEKRL